ncbi:MAG: alpha/beta fold hydrolase [Pseudomonadota bacterium]
MNGCLLIHGLTGTPATVSVVRNALLASGFKVAAPCLAGHGGSVDELARSGWRDWYDTVRIAFQTLRRETERVYCAGISLGALLALKLALDEGWGVRALALMATPLELSWPTRAALSIVRHSPLRWGIFKVPKNLDQSVADPEGRMRYSELSLPAIPASSAFELSDLQKEIRGQLSSLSNPILMLHGQGDLVAPIRNVELIKGMVASDIVEKMILPRSRHVITMDYEKDQVAKAVVDFFKKFA